MRVGRRLWLSRRRCRTLHLDLDQPRDTFLSTLGAFLFRLREDSWLMVDAESKNPGFVSFEDSLVGFSRKLLE